MSNVFDQFDAPAASAAPAQGQGNPFDQFDQATPPPPPAGYGQNVNATATGVARGLGGLAGLPELLSRGDRWVLERLFGPERGEQIASWLSPGQLGPTAQQATTAILDTVGVPETDAETRVGKVGQRTVEFAAGSLIPGGLLRNVVTGAAAGAASEIAGQAAEGTALEAPARLAGALVPGAAGAVVGATRGSTVRDAAAAIRDLTPQQADEARALMQEAQRLGTPLTVAEAVQQVAGPNRALSAAQDLAQNSVGGRRVMEPFLDARDAGARQAAENTVAPFVPQGRDAQLIPSRLQQEAAGEVSGAYQARTQAVAPLYAQAAQDATAPQAAAAITGVTTSAVQRLDALAQRDASGLLAPQLREIRDAFASGQPVDWDSLNRARRFFRDQLRNQGQPGMPVLDRELASTGGRIVNDLSNALKQIVPSLRRADVEYQRLSRELVEPIERGVIGRVAQTDSAAEQRGLLFPRSTMAGSVPTTPEVVGDAFGRLAGPTAGRRSVATDALDNARGLLGTEMRTRLDEAFQLRSTGPTDRAGAAAASRLSPTEGRGDTLDAAFRALPGGDQAADGFNRLMQVLSAQTFAPARNSATAGRTEALNQAGRGGLLGAARTVSNPFQALPKWLEDWQRNGNTEALAQSLTTEAGLSRLRLLAGVDDPARLRSLARGLVGLSGATRAAGNGASAQ